MIGRGSAGQILTVAQMRAGENALIRNGDTVQSLMERAGKGAAQWVWRAAAGRSVTVLCGSGNNGGDGYVIARELQKRSARVQVVAPQEPTTDAAMEARRSFSGVVVDDVNGSTDCSGVLVDCLFGSGLTRPLQADHAKMLTRLAAMHEFRIALDVPSGVASDTGAVLNDGLCSFDLTIALGAWKFAHWLMPGMAMMGERVLVDIGVTQIDGAARLARRPELTQPALDAHKYSRGLLAVVGGAMLGAAVLAARSAMRSGAGYVKLLAGNKPCLLPDELVVDDGPLEKALGDSRIRAVLVGPGLGRDAEAAERLRTVLASGFPCVLDADALVLLEPKMLKGRSAPVICTPHAGELQAMCERFGVKKEDRLARISRLAELTGATIIAKGPDTVIAGAEEALVIAPPAPSWLSTAGTGDVLAGIVASRLAAGATPQGATEDAVWLHGEAARIAGPVLIASDLINALPAAYSAVCDRG